ncbi:MAG: hypothetical protein LBL97_06660 [Prevotellaceae bacterium]|jgi:hypothetical protein|nr:hypothetical protein [Prevotellaceae bacterium]
MRKIVILLLIGLTATAGYAQKVKPVNYGGSVNLLEVKGRGSSAVLTLRTLGYGKNDALAQEDAEVRVIRALLYQGFSKDYPPVISIGESEAEQKSGGKLQAFFDDKAYKDCISGVRPMGKLDKVKGEKVKKKPFDITVNYYVLKNKVSGMNIDSFGF